MTEHEEVVAVAAATELPNVSDGPAAPTAAQLVSRRQVLRSAAASIAVVGLGALPATLRASVALAEPPLRAPGTYSATVATSWFDVLAQLVRTTPGFSPPVASRAFAYAGVALYETVAAGSSAHRTLAGQLRGLSALPGTAGGPHHWALAANATLASIARGLWPTAPASSREAVDRLEDRFVTELGGGVPPGLARRSARYGRDVAAAVLAWARTDGGHEGYLHNFPADHDPPTGPGLWEPTPPAFLPALQPRWGDNRPFCLSSPTSCPAGIPTPYSEDPASLWIAEAREVQETVDALTPDQAAIAHFWADDPGATSTPPGHSVSIATQVLRTRDADLLTAAELYARLGIAVADAFIACWHAKYAVNLVRPITTIQQLLDPDWGGPLRPLPVTTPPFPEYPSGHSVQSAAAAAVLTAAFGTATAFTDATHLDRGLPARSFASFDAAAEEAAISRLYGGIHFRPAIVDGLAQGRCIGQAATALMLRS
jgi:hypothetical protein